MFLSLQWTTSFSSPLSTSPLFLPFPPPPLHHPSFLPHPPSSPPLFRPSLFSCSLLIFLLLSSSPPLLFSSSPPLLLFSFPPLLLSSSPPSLLLSLPHFSLTLSLLHAHSKWHPPSGKNISTASCNSVQAVVAVGSELHYLEIKPNLIDEIR